MHLAILCVLSEFLELLPTVSTGQVMWLKKSALGCKRQRQGTTPAFFVNLNYSLFT
jgi:hypothetical protein